MPSFALRTRARHLAVHSALFSALAVGATAGASAASAADASSAHVGSTSVTSTAASTRVAGTHVGSATPGARAAAAPTTAASTGASGHAQAPAPTGTVKVFGMPAPATPDQATNDDEMLAWTLKHSTPAERRDIAANLGVSYPAAVDLLGTTCDKGHGYVAVWVINFSTKQAHWNVTLDGVGYAGAAVLPQSLDYGAIGIPDGPHTVAFVNPATGAVGARMRTNLHCGVPAPVVTKPKPVVTKPHPKPVATKPVVTKPVVTKPVVTKPVVTTPKSVVKTAPAKPVVAPHRPRAAHPRGAVMPHRVRSHVAAHGSMGPKVQTDFVATPTSQGLSPALVTALLGAVAGSLLVARRFMRV